MANNNSQELLMAINDHSAQINALADRINAQARNERLRAANHRQCDLATASPLRKEVFPAWQCSGLHHTTHL